MQELLIGKQFSPEKRQVFRGGNFLNVLGTHTIYTIIVAVLSLLILGRRRTREEEAHEAKNMISTCVTAGYAEIQVRGRGNRFRSMQDRSENEATVFYDVGHPYKRATRDRVKWGYKKERF